MVVEVVEVVEVVLVVEVVDVVLVVDVVEVVLVVDVVEVVLVVEVVDVVLVVEVVVVVVLVVVEIWRSPNCPWRCITGLRFPPPSQYQAGPHSTYIIINFCYTIYMNSFF